MKRALRRTSIGFVLAMMVTFITACVSVQAYAKTKSISHYGKTKEAAVTLKKGTTVVKPGYGWCKFKAAKTKTYTFTFDMPSRKSGTADVEFQSKEGSYLFGETDLKNKTSYLALCSARYWYDMMCDDDEEDAASYSSLRPSRSIRFKLRKGQTSYLYINSYKTSFRINISDKAKKRSTKKIKKRLQKKMLTKSAKKKVRKNWYHVKKVYAQMIPQGKNFYTGGWTGKEKNGEWVDGVLETVAYVNPYSDYAYFGAYEDSDMTGGFFGKYVVKLW